MSGQTRSCRARYSASRSALTRPRKQTRSTRAPYLRDCGSLHPLSGVQRSTIIRYACQKLNWPMLAGVKTNGGPSSTVLSAPTVYEPSLPAVNFWPCEPLSLPDAISTAAYAARKPRSFGFHSTNSLMVPSETYFLSESGVPSPVSAILPRYLGVSSTAAAAAIPTVVGEMMPIRFGNCWSSPWVTWVAVVGSSLPQTVETSFPFGYFFR